MTTVNVPSETEEPDHWFRNGKFANLLISCEGTTFTVHEDVIFSQSKVLKAAGCSGFRESMTKRIFLSDKSHLVKRMIPFFYYGYYPDIINSDGNANLEENIKLHIDMYSLADKYEVPALGKVALPKFNAYLSRLHDSNRDTKFILECIRSIYESTPPSDRGLRDLVMDRLPKHARSIASHGHLCDSLKAVFFEFIDFSWDVVKMLLDMNLQKDLDKEAAAKLVAITDLQRNKREEPETSPRIKREDSEARLRARSETLV